MTAAELRAALGEACDHVGDVNEASACRHYECGRRDVERDGTAGDPREARRCVGRCRELIRGGRSEGAVAYLAGRVMAHLTALEEPDR